MKLPKPFDEWTTYDGHAGIDFPQARGTPIPALAAGVVTFVGWNRNKPTGDSESPGKAAGNTRIVDYGGGLEVRYCHLDNLDGPRVGERVAAGDSCGPVGDTGLASGPHLHMEVWLHGVIQKGSAFWRHISDTTTAPRPALAGHDSEEFDMPITNDEAQLIANLTARTILEWNSPGLDKSSGGAVPEESIARRLRVLRAHTNGLPARLNKQDAQIAALTAAVKALASSKAIDPERVEAEIHAAVKDALSGWSLTFTPGEPDDEDGR